MKIYKISYNNGRIVQIKKLVSVDIYINFIKPIEDLINDLDIEIYNCKKKNKDKKKLLENKKEEAKRKLAEYKPYFIVGSPLYKAIGTGILELPKYEGGMHIIDIQEIN